MNNSNRRALDITLAVEARAKYASMLSKDDRRRICSFSSGDELVALVEKTIADLGATTKREMGKVMGALTAATGGNFDKAQAAKEVGSRLS